MGIYSEDRTMLTVDPEAESKVMEGYENISDLYSIIEDAVNDDKIIYQAMVESLASVVMLDEADGAKSDKLTDTFCKATAANTAKLAKIIARNQSVGVSTKKNIETIKNTKVNKCISKYKDKFDMNKDVASSSKFTIKYNEDALLCTSKELDKFVTGAGKAMKDIANNCVNLASNNTKEITSNNSNIFKVKAFEGYAQAFCMCKEKESKVQGNPFNKGLKVNSLVKEMNDTDSVCKAIDKLNKDAKQALDIFTKNMNKLCENAKKNSKETSKEDLAVIYALGAIATGLGKAYVHAMKDIIKGYKNHISECIREYIGVAKLKAVRVANEAAEPSIDPIDAKNEAAEPSIDPIDVVKEEIEAVKNDDNLETAKKIEGEFEDDLDPITDGDIEKIFNNEPEDETKKDEGIDPVKPSDVPMNDGSAHEAAEPSIDSIDKVTEAEEFDKSSTKIIYTDTVDAVAEAYIIKQDIELALEMMNI